MNVVFWILFGIDMLIFVFDFINAFSKGGLKKALKTIDSASDQIINETINSKDSSKPEKAGKIIGLVLIICLVLYITLGLPIISIVRSGLVIGLFTYFVIEWLYYIFILTKMHKHKAKNLELEFRYSKIIVYAIVRFYIIILLLFGWSFNILAASLELYTSNYQLNDFISVFFPVIFFAIIMINIYVLYGLMLLNYKKRYPDKDIIKKWSFNINYAILFGILSSFLGLILIVDVNLDTILLVDEGSYLEVMNIAKLILTAILIPALYSSLNRSTN